MRQCGWLRHCATSRDVVGWSPDVIGFHNGPYPSCRTIALGSTQPLMEMSTRNHPEDKWWSERKADNFAAICEPIFYKM
jgi:hypothetical protein